MASGSTRPLKRGPLRCDQRGQKDNTHVTQTFGRITRNNPELNYINDNPKCAKLRINGKGRETPVADAATLVEIAWHCPGRDATAFKRKGPEIICRILQVGGAFTLVDEIQRRRTQMADTAEEKFQLADVQGSPQQATSHKRCLDDDDEVFAAKKQQVLRQIRQEAAGTELAIIKQHVQGSMGILDMLSAGNAPPATMQLLQTIRHMSLRAWAA